MASLDAELARILQRRETLKLERDRCALILSPLRRLPIELLLEIFTRVFRSGTGTGETNVHNVSQVCQAWRQLVFGTPLFWTEVVLPSGPKDQSFEALWEHLSLHVNRAQGQPISLTINALPEATFDHLIKAIFASDIAHWAAISLHATKVEHIQQTLSYFRSYSSEVGRLSSLAFTSAQVHRKPGEFAAKTKIMDFSTFSSLRQFRMDDVDISLLECQFPANWAALTSLSLGAVSSTEEFWQHVFNRCPNLETLTITPEDDDDYEYEGNDDLPTPITLSRLRTLAIMSYTHPSLFLSKISAPLLEQLTFHFVAPSDGDDMSACIFLSRLTGHLRLFRCTGDFFTHIIESHDSLGGFNALQNITKLVISGPFRTHEDDEYPASEFPTIFDDIETKIAQVTKLQVVEVLEHQSLDLQHLASLASLLQFCSVEAGEEDNSLKSKGPILQQFVVTQERGSRHPVERLAKYMASGLLVTSAASG